MVIRDGVFEKNALPRQGNRRQSAALIGGVVLARALQNEQLSKEILKSVRQKVS
jgi:hypothetical protein